MKNSKLTVAASFLLLNSLAFSTIAIDDSGEMVSVLNGEFCDPIAVINGPIIVNSCEEFITFDASGSHHPEPSCGAVIVEYAWDFGNDEAFDFITTGPFLTLPYGYFENNFCGGLCLPGFTTPIKLQVTDNLSKTGDALSDIIFPVPEDSDGDGVADNDDSCPGGAEPPNMRSFWGFRECSGVTAFDSVGGNHLTVTNAVIFRR